MERLWKTGSAADEAVAVWRRLAAGRVECASVIGGHGAAWCAFAAGCVMAAVRCGRCVQRRARWLAFLLREKVLDKLCKSILDWKQGTTPTTIGTAPRMISRTAPDAGRLWQHDRRYTVRPARHLQAARCAGNLLR